MGRPATWSLTISCQIRIWAGYARASPPRSIAITGSLGASQSTALTGSNVGWSIGGMPSGGGPPGTISEGSTSGETDPVGALSLGGRPGGAHAARKAAVAHNTASGILRRIGDRFVRAPLE